MVRARRNPSAIARSILVAVTAATVATSVASAQDPAGGMRASPEINPPGVEMARGTSRPAADAAPITPSTPAAKAVQDLLAKSVTAVIAGHHGRDLIGLLTKADRDRLGDPPAGDWSDVDAAADAFQAAWRARYGLSFDVANKVPLAFTEPTMHVDGLIPTTGPSTGPGLAGRPGSPPVTVTLTDPTRRSGVLLHVTHEGPGDGDWRLDLSSAATAASLHDGLLRHLKIVTDNQKSWPTDVDQAYVYATQHLLAAVGEATAPR